MSQNYDKRAREAIALQIKNLSAAQVQTFGEILSANPVKAILDIHAGEEKATAWGCDLTYEYVTINADYRS